MPIRENSIAGLFKLFSAVLNRGEFDLYRSQNDDLALPSADCTTQAPLARIRAIV